MENCPPAPHSPAASRQKKLPGRHGRAAQQEHRQRDDTGKQGKIKHDARAFFSLQAHLTHKGVGRTGTQSAQRPDKRRDIIHMLKRRLNDQQRAGKRRRQTGCLHWPHLFFQNNIRQDHRKKRTELVEHIGIGQHQMVDGIKIT